MKIILLCLLIVTPYAISSENLRLATYNSKFLSACMNKVRVINYQSVINNLNADVVALQEVRDRYAVERYFPATDWNIIIDDDSRDDMNLTFAIRKGFQYRVDSGNLKNVDKNIDFAFPKSNPNFIDERRVLKLFISYKGKEILLLNHHAKSRYNGRMITDEQRTNAALDLLYYIYQAPTEYVALFGDFNDTPDDRSLNTLERGIDSPMLIENVNGSFLINITEPLTLKEHVSFGLKSLDKTDSIVRLVNPSIPGSRKENIDNFLNDIPARKALYDQILVSPALITLFSQPTAAKIFDDVVGIDGNDDTRASDHLPVYVDFHCPDCDAPKLRITALLPNPLGSDSGNELIKIQNFGNSFQGKIIIQDASLKNEVIEIDLAKQQTIIHKIQSGVTLNNNGDTIRILNKYEELLDEVTYSSSKEQMEIFF